MCLKSEINFVRKFDFSLLLIRALIKNSKKVRDSTFGCLS